jgi:parallel beta-helix repeat protein
MKKEVLVIGIIILLLDGLAVPLTDGRVNNDSDIILSNGGTLYVGGSGHGNYSKIQDAIDNSTDGDTIFVFSGLYNEQPYINKSINLQGEDKSTTIIKGFGRGDAVLCEADNIVIHGFTIKYGFGSKGSWWTSGIQLDRCNFCLIYDNIIYENFNGIRLDYSENNTITNNIIRSNQRRGIWIDTLCYNTIISNNTIENNGYTGVHIDKANRCIINDNFVNNNTDKGIYIYSSSYNTISYNKLTENDYNGILIWAGSNNHINSNEFFNNGFWVELTYSNNNLVENNSIDNKPLVFLENVDDKIIDNAGQVILLNCKNITIKDLNISNVYYGIETMDTSNCVIINCTIHNNFGAIYIGYDYPDVSENITIKNNNIYDNQKGIYLRSSYYSEISDNQVINNKLFGINISGWHNEIRGNTIHRNKDGLYIKGSYNLISGNIIDSNSFGFFAVRLALSKLTKNEIAFNGRGVYLVDSESNIVSKNNIFQNHKDAYHKDSLLNKWRRNFWNKRRMIGPKFIWGALYFWPGHWQPPRIVPVFRLDIFYARFPYDIRGVNG